MQALCKEIRITVSQEAQIVKAVFPDPSSVMKVFIQRVFAQVVCLTCVLGSSCQLLIFPQIQQHLETLVSRASAISTLAVLRILNLTHNMCSSLVDDLKTYDATLTEPSSRGLALSSGPLATMLDRAMEEIFVPWLEGQRYLDSESKNLVELYAGLLSRFTRYHVRHYLQCAMVGTDVCLVCRRQFSKPNPTPCSTKLCNSSPRATPKRAHPHQLHQQPPPPYRNMPTLSPPLHHHTATQQAERSRQHLARAQRPSLRRLWRRQRPSCPFTLP